MSSDRLLRASRARPRPPGCRRRPAVPSRLGSLAGRAAALWLWAALLGGCDVSPRPPAPAPRRVPAGPAASSGAAAGARRVRVIGARETPRSPYHLELKAVMPTPESCEVRLTIRSRREGQASVEFDLPEGAAASEGDLRRRCPLERGVIREERLVARVGSAGHQFIAASVEMDGYRAEAYVEIGEPETASQRGLRTRTSAGGDPVLRVETER